MMPEALRTIAILLCGGALAWGQQAPTEEQEQTPAEDTANTPDASPRMFSPYAVPKYDGDLWHRPALTGDWAGLRRDLAQEGISFEFELTQVLQGNAHGGASTSGGLRYAGSADYTLKLDTGRMGLWPGGQWTIHAETQFGTSANGDTGAVMAPNFDALVPTPDEGRTTLSEVYLSQPLSEKFVIIAGKADGTRFADKNAFANSERTQFLNAAFRVNPIPFPFAPYTALGAFAVFLPFEWLTIAGGVMNTNDSATRTGFDTGFHSPQGWTAALEIDFNIKPFELPGHQRFGYLYSNKNFDLLDQDIRVGLPGPRLFNLLRVIGAVRNPDTRPDDFAIYYNFDQYIYREVDDPAQGVGLFGRFGWSTGQSNPIETFYSIGLSATGIFPNRDRDTLGLGYFYVDMSDDLPALLNLVSEQGVELYYNIEVAPWIHITPDLQVIVDPGNNDNDVAIVYGMRVQMTF